MTDIFLKLLMIPCKKTFVLNQRTMFGTTLVQIYSSCEEAHRLKQSGELNVPPEYTDEYCKGPCLAETHHVLDCINGILKGFIFFNRATLNDVRETIKSGCGYGPKRGVNTVYNLFLSSDYMKHFFLTFLSSYR